jgi:hypothetical protein
MKKIYQAPAVLMVNIHIENTLLTSSPGAKAEGYNASSEVLSRKGGFSMDQSWDDEGEEEDF